MLSLAYPLKNLIGSDPLFRVPDKYVCNYTLHIMSPLKTISHDVQFP